MTRAFHFADNLRLPVDAVTQKIGMLGRTGSGKTYAATKLAEEMLNAGAQIIALDPVGVWFGLRLSADGKSPGIAIPVFGGLHGDIPLEPTGGKLVADLIIDRGISVVLDVSQFEFDADKARFATDFTDRFFYRKKSAPSAVHIFIEECQEFIPQNIQRGEERMLHAFQRMIRLGRNFGIGATLITQRPQDVNKKALNQAECVFAFQLTGPQERKAVDGWMSDKGLDLDLAADLPKLNTGEAHVWSPAWLKISKVVKINPKRTFNASSTPEVGKRAQQRELAAIDLEALRAEMSATIEKAKAEDPKELRKRISDLEKSLKQAQGNKPETKIEWVERPVLRKGELGKLRECAKEMKKAELKIASIHDAWRENLQIIGERIDGLCLALDRVEHGTNSPQGPPTALVPRTAHSRPTAGSIAQPRSSAGNGAGPLGKGEHCILVAIAQHREGVTREQITVLTGYKRSSRDTYLQRLRAQGLIDDGAVIVATEAGIAALGPDFQPLPTGEELQQYWLQKLGGGEKAILEKLIFAYPSSVDKKDLDEATGYQRSSRDTYIQRLRARQLVVDEGRGLVRASEVLFG